MRLVNTKACVVAVGVAALLCFLLLRETRAERLPIKTYTTADGLARDHVTRIVQDSKGFIWFCTTGGLSRFDGYKFINYGIEDGLADRNVTDFLESRNGAYWVATYKGLCRFIPEALPPATASNSQAPTPRFEVYYPSPDAKARAINSICEDHAGTIWCGTEAGLFRVDQAGGQPLISFVDIIKPARVEEGRVPTEAIIEDRRGSLWIIAQSGLYRRRTDGAVERYTADQGLPEGVAVTLLQANDERIWIGSNRGLYQLVPDPKPDSPVVARLYTSKDGLADDYVFSLSQSSDGRLWAGTITGLNVLGPARNKRSDGFRSYARTNGLSNSEITSLCEDRDHNLWIGTASEGVMRLAARGFATYDQTDGLGPTRRVGTIFDNRAGKLCVISDSAFISEFDRGRFTTARLTLPGRISNWGWGWYQVMFQDSAGEWWMNTGEGLVRYPRVASVPKIARARPKSIYKMKDGLPTNEIFRLFEDSRRDIWISTVGNPDAVLARWDRATETIHRYFRADGIPDSAPTAFCEDGAGNLWIGFYNGGLLRYHAGRFTPFRLADGLPAGMVRGLFLDHSGRLWVAASEGGAARVDEPAAQHPRFVTYSTADGLSSNQATCVTEDQWGMIYVGTDRGLDKLDPATGHIKHYTTAEGLAGSFINVSFRGADGSLWFGTLQGLSRLVPEPDRPVSPPDIFITGLRVAGTPYAIPEVGAVSIDGPELRASQNNVQIEFSGLSLAAGESLRYQYKLEGASSDWSAASDQRVVSYASLAPGSYRFWVRAISSDGTVSEIPASARFSILPPLWRRWWAIALAVTLAATAVYALYRYRVRRLLEIERVRTRIAADLHDDIGANLTRIGILSEVAHSELQAEQPRLSSPLGSIAQISRECVASMGDIVWAIDPTRDHLVDLVHRMRRFASEVLSNRKIEFQFRAPASDEDLTLGPDVRRDVFLIFKEAVNNAARHAQCSCLAIDLAVEGSRLVLRIGDNGIGFDASVAGEGQGLASMKRRAAGLGAELRLTSAKGEGTEILLKVPRKAR